MIKHFVSLSLFLLFFNGLVMGQKEIQIHQTITTDKGFLENKLTISNLFIKLQNSIITLTYEPQTTSIILVYHPLNIFWSGNSETFYHDAKRFSEFQKSKSLHEDSTKKKPIYLDTNWQFTKSSKKILPINTQNYDVELWQYADSSIEADLWLSSEIASQNRKELKEFWRLLNTLNHQLNNTFSISLGGLSNPHIHGFPLLFEYKNPIQNQISFKEEVIEIIEFPDQNLNEPMDPSCTALSFFDLLRSAETEKIK
jgi:hypothetical protein